MCSSLGRDAEHCFPCAVASSANKTGSCWTISPPCSVSRIRGPTRMLRCSDCCSSWPVRMPTTPTTVRSRVPNPRKCRGRTARAAPPGSRRFPDPDDHLAPGGRAAAQQPHQSVRHLLLGSRTHGSTSARKERISSWWSVTTKPGRSRAWARARTGSGCRAAADVVEYHVDPVGRLPSAGGSRLADAARHTAAQRKADDTNRRRNGWYATPTPVTGEVPVRADQRRACHRMPAG